jgi:hypothetical protein
VPVQQTSAPIPADQRSAFRSLRGVPAVAAVLIAVTATLLGFAIEAGSGHHDLGATFAVLYVVGCIAAVLLVRHCGIFSAVIQPPLILFVTVPVAYFLMHGSAFGGLKDVLISCGYPLIERFPLMMMTSAGVLLIGMARWYLATGEDIPAAAQREAGPSMFAGLSAKLSETFAKPRHVSDRAASPRPSRSGERPPRTRDPRRDAPPRARQPRPPRDDYFDAPRRQPPRRMARSADPERQRRTPPPPRRDPRDPYPPYPPYPPPRRNPPPQRESTHHPVSRVRYRGDMPEDRY